VNLGKSGNTCSPFGRFACTRARMASRALMTAPVGSFGAPATTSGRFAGVRRASRWNEKADTHAHFLRWRAQFALAGWEVSVSALEGTYPPIGGSRQARIDWSGPGTRRKCAASGIAHANDVIVGINMVSPSRLGIDKQNTMPREMQVAGAQVTRYPSNTIVIDLQSSPVPARVGNSAYLSREGQCRVQ
jgi:hypothetical protein